MTSIAEKVQTDTHTHTYIYKIGKRTNLTDLLMLIIRKITY